MISKLNIQDELQQIAPQLAGISNKMPFLVDENYFSNFPAAMLSKVVSSKVAEVPAGYFDNFASNMLTIIRQNDWEAELKQVAPSLLSISKSPVQWIPDGYFEQLPNFLSTEQVRKSSRLYLMVKKWAVISVAAAVLVSCLLGWWLFSEQTNSNLPITSVNVEKALEKIDAPSIENYLLENDALVMQSNIILTDEDNMDDYIKTIDTEQLEHFLNENPITKTTSRKVM